MEIKLTIPSAFTHRLNGRVTAAFDGDTVAISAYLRIYGIDAPEEGQAYFKRSRKALEDIVYARWGTILTFKVRGVDMHGRLLAQIFIDGVDVGRKMVRRGHAWSFQGDYAADEQHARAAKLGLWKGKDPVPPWEFRKTDKFKNLQRERMLARGDSTNCGEQDRLHSFPGDG